ncbi:uncharacterized protein TRIREDRAFT_121594 [Trichoderma reesei QM6a]|jgi:hypothetical protein|uniref:Predicted protein n=2 Tax=Hypocrea jecorina TaxID=51453 RepID=G0RI91_HYPJQ|nr:uncharacterized protein TRIREDRAFT_121594 [Trichoderma reesei QM6a]EGR49106.1 predicted protein [Trichoderma reesei QM6a]ETS02566.1 hypothetical protein M419DRAFT_137007 [Trichoderma reesei RUT C-30]
MDTIKMDTDANASAATTDAPVIGAGGTTRDRIQNFLSPNQIEVFSDQSLVWDFDDCETLEEQFDCGLKGLEQLRSEVVEATREGNQRALMDTVTASKELQDLMAGLAGEAEQTAIDMLALKVQESRIRLEPWKDAVAVADKWEGVAWKVAKRHDDMLAQLDAALLLMEKQCVFAKLCWSSLSWDARRVFCAELGGLPQGALWSDGFKAEHFQKLRSDDNMWSVRMKWTAYKGATRLPRYIFLDSRRSGGKEQTLVLWAKVDPAASGDVERVLEVEVRLRNRLLSNLRVDAAWLFRMMTY